jgi:zinc protease
MGRRGGPCQEALPSITEDCAVDVAALRLANLEFEETLMRLALALLASTTMFLSPAFAGEDVSVPIATLVDQVSIPHEDFTLANGLRVIVHTDRKAPVVAVSVWYDVGSKHEPMGKTGFAHLFEHLMFEGSENVANFDETVIRLGGANNNGSTSYDRTNYVETVPVGALDQMLYIEADRMGYLLGKVSQERLDAQRGVVQNEKRQGDNQPYGLVEYAQSKALMAPEHPYGHGVIGSMADLDAASLDDVRGWFRQHYGPNNAVLVLAGDIDVKTARPMIEKHFGAIKRGPQQSKLTVAVPTLAAPKSEVMKDGVANVRLYRTWSTPGTDNPVSVPLDLGASILGGLASSRLDNILVREEKLAVSVTAGFDGNTQLGGFLVTVDVKPGVDPLVAGRRLDAIIADFVKNGPTEDEVQRAKMRSVSGQIAGLEEVGGFGGKAVTLAEGALYAKDSNFYKKQLARMAATTPAAVKAALQSWLTRPVYALMVVPGERDPYDETKKVETKPKPAAAIARVARPAAPKVGAIDTLTFPKVEHARLQNGIEIVYARRTAVPTTQVSLSFDAGNVADPRDRMGTQAVTLALLTEGANGRNSAQIASAQERLGTQVSASATMDRTSVDMFALSGNLDASLGLFADIVLKPDFAPAEVERIRAQQLSRINSETKNPQALALRLLPPLLYGSAHPYGISFTGSGDLASVGAVSRDEIIAFHHQWFRPEKATFFVVSDRPLPEITRALNARFGAWAATGAAGAKAAMTVPAAGKARIVLVDRPDSPQSLIYAGQVLPVQGTADLDLVTTANQAIGSGFLSRINNDLRQTKGWSYGVRGGLNRVANDVPYIISAPVQADKTGESIAALLQNYTDFVGTKGITPEEYDRIIGGNIRELPGSFETSREVLSGLQRNFLFKRPDTYYTMIAAKYRSMKPAEMDSAFRAIVKPDQFIWVVVGDAKIVRPQLEKLGLPVEVMALPTAK